MLSEVQFCKKFSLPRPKRTSFVKKWNADPNQRCGRSPEIRELKREGRYLVARRHQHESHRLERRQGRQEIEAQLAETYQPFGFSLINAFLMQDEFRTPPLTHHMEIPMSMFELKAMGYTVVDEPIPELKQPTRWYYTHEGD